MSSPFAVTTTVSNISLSGSRVAEAVFTVTNTSGRSLRGRARLVVEDPGAESWFTVLGDAEREFEHGSTEQYVVKIESPSGALAGSHAFRLDMVGVANPDEEYSQGPTVTFTTPVPAAPKKAFPWWIPVVAGVLLLVIGVAAYLLWPRSVTIPDFAQAGLRVDAAEATVEAMGLALGGRTPVPNEREPNFVVNSLPPAGQQVDRGTPVSFVVSLGTSTPTPTATPTATATPSPTPTITPTPTPRQANVTVEFTSIDIQNVGQLSVPFIGPLFTVQARFEFMANDQRVRLEQRVSKLDAIPINRRVQLTLSEGEQLSIAVTGELLILSTKVNLGTIAKAVHESADGWDEGRKTVRTRSSGGVVVVDYVINVEWID